MNWFRKKTLCHRRLLFIFCTTATPALFANPAARFCKDPANSCRFHPTWNEIELKTDPQHALSLRLRKLHTEVPALSRLRLSNNHLTELPAEIGTLTSLTHLSLEQNSLTQLPETIGNLTALTNLNLNYNKLIALPTTIGNLTALTHLYLFWNQLTELPASIENLTALTHLHLSKNRLTEVPASIGNLTALTELRLSLNPLESLLLPDHMAKRCYQLALVTQKTPQAYLEEAKKHDYSLEFSEEEPIAGPREKVTQYIGGRFLVLGVEQQDEWDSIFYQTKGWDTFVSNYQDFMKKYFPEIPFVAPRDYSGFFLNFVEY